MDQMDQCGNTALSSYLEFNEDTEPEIIKVFLDAGFSVSLLEDEYLERIYSDPENIDRVKEAPTTATT